MAKNELYDLMTYSLDKLLGSLSLIKIASFINLFLIFKSCPLETLYFIKKNVI